MSVYWFVAKSLQKYFPTATAALFAQQTSLKTQSNENQNLLYEQIPRDWVKYQAGGL